MGESYYFGPQILTKLDTETIKRTAKKTIIRTFYFGITPLNQLNPNDLFRRYINYVFLKDFQIAEKTTTQKSKNESVVSINHTYDSLFQK